MGKVYVLIDSRGVILRIDGGYTVPTDLAEWILVDEGEGDRYNLCQGHYLPGALMDDDGVYNYKLVSGAILERTEEEKEADRAVAEFAEGPSTAFEDRLTELEAAFDALMSGEVSPDE